MTPFSGEAERWVWRRLTSAVDLRIGAAIAVLNFLILGPWCLTAFSDQPWNNGYIYVATARMFRDLPWTWNPLQYGGSPFRYLYPPLFHVLVIVLQKLPWLSLARAVHLTAAAGYAAVPACLYLLARQMFRDRAPALVAALAYSVFPSPVYVLSTWRAIAHSWADAPWGFVTLVAYEEIPHTFGFALALLAVAAAWRNRWVMASLLTAGVFLTNWPALIGLGFMLAGLAVARLRDLGIAGTLARVAGLTGTAYGLSAFWMTPGYFVSSTLLNRIVLRHTLLNAPWTGVTWTILAVCLAIVGLCCWSRIPGTIAMPAVWSALSGLVVVAYTLTGSYLMPSPHRYMLEFNAGLVLLLASMLAALPPRARTVAAISLLAAGSLFSMRFVTKSWRLEPKSLDPATSVTRQIAVWLSGHAGRERVAAAGELDSTLNLWSDVAQIGGSGQDISNFLMFAAERQITFGCETDSERIAALWLKAVNSPWLVVHGAASREYFHWYASPEKFDRFPAAWENGEGDTVRRVPGFGTQEAVVVDLAAMTRLPRLRNTADAVFLEAYTRWAAGVRTAKVHWKSADEAEIDADVAPGEALLLKVNDDPGWRVRGGRVRADPIGFQVIEGPPGQRHVSLSFGASWDTWMGRGITLMTLALLLARGRPGLGIALCAVLPAIAAWMILIASAPVSTAAAEEAFVRLHPPLINPGGIVVGKRGDLDIYGLDFGGLADAVRVLVNDEEVPPTFRTANMIKLQLPLKGPATAKVAIEVNGCRGNEFLTRVRESEER